MLAAGADLSARTAGRVAKHALTSIAPINARAIRGPAADQGPPVSVRSWIEGGSADSSGSIDGSGSQQLPQHERQDTAVLVVLDFDRRIDAQSDGNALRGSVGAMHDQSGVLLRADPGFQTLDVKCL